MKNFNLNKYMFELRAKGRYSFTFDEFKKSNLSDKALRQALFSAKSKGAIFTVRKGKNSIQQ